MNKSTTQYPSNIITLSHTAETSEIAITLVMIMKQYLHTYRQVYALKILKKHLQIIKIRLIIKE